MLSNCDINVGTIPTAATDHHNFEWCISGGMTWLWMFCSYNWILCWFHCWQRPGWTLCTLEMYPSTTLPYHRCVCLQLKFPWSQNCCCKPNNGKRLFWRDCYGILECVTSWNIIGNCWWLILHSGACVHSSFNNRFICCMILCRMRKKGKVTSGAFCSKVWLYLTKVTIEGEHSQQVSRLNIYLPSKLLT